MWTTNRISSRHSSVYFNICHDFCYLKCVQILSSFCVIQTDFILWKRLINFKMIFHFLFSENRKFLIFLLVLKESLRHFICKCHDFTFPCCFPSFFFGVPNLLCWILLNLQCKTFRRSLSYYLGYSYFCLFKTVENEIKSS